ncbi:RNA polymerase sigma factor [Gracilibacillus dipsosauri]|uniref:Sigma-70 family RNA polymerase sigma factor n=1 Tax=Gracilibacillus dipsosauri TaxID=178340 RepID=A0A317KVN9_9BACI|nr:RNA polymerase sigma factor [Gracilibacillus dipsosauri]PWU67363.1 sigma-70 family RNA polymerase sigma factor [Gracilibacillus dipsosauri]
MKLEELYKEVYPRIYAFFYVKTVNKQIAEDLTQEVFYQAIKKFHTFSYESTLDTWLFAIAKNRLRNFYRSKRYQNLLLEKLPKEERNPISPEEQLLEKEKQKTLNEAINQLEDVPKEIVMLRVYGELSFKEIATLVNKSENHTRIIFHRAKLIIQKELDDQNG